MESGIKVKIKDSVLTLKNLQKIKCLLYKGENYLLLHGVDIVEKIALLQHTKADGQTVR